MKFLIQRTNGEVRHDFAFTLIENLRFRRWLDRRSNKNDYIVKFIDYNDEVLEPNDIYPMPFKPFHKDYVPVGSVEFVTDFLNHFYGIIPKPINVPVELALRGFTQRHIFNGDETSFEGLKGKWFIKSNDKIKGYKEVHGFEESKRTSLPKGNYQYSKYINIESEWRAFVYEGKLIGLQNYSGDFTVFPNVEKLKLMIAAYKSAPIAYTLDVGVDGEYDLTFVIECHSMVAVGLYGFNNHKLPNMLYRAFKEIISSKENKQ